jgi:SAM-dependent methyltransferase
MGISSQTARLILREHLHRPITGRILSIGRQTVHLTPEQALDMVRAELGILPLRGAQDIELDHSTRGAQSRRYIGDKAFYSLFTDAKYHCVDQSSYEGADIVFDICSAEIPSHLENAFDFIFDGSTLDNVFDPASAIRNLTKVSRNDGGRVFHVDRVSRRHNVYTAFALSWFHDYYAINNFRDCQVYLAQWDGDDQITSRWDFYHYCPLRSENDDFVFFGQDSW